MIKLTYNDLMHAWSDGSMHRLFAIPKPIAVAFKNRKLRSRIKEEVDNFNELRQELIINFVGNAESFVTSPEWVELLNTLVDIDSDKISKKDLKKVKLSDRDETLLAPFLMD